MPTPEDKAREKIDLQLSDAGWIVLPSGSSLSSTPSALYELSGNTGRADYILYLDGKACGIIEAKRSEHSLEGVQDQSATYSVFCRWQDPDTCWLNPLPFRFEANGNEIQFTDARDPESRVRPLFHFPRPEYLRKLLVEAEHPRDSLRRCLSSLPTSHPLEGFMANASYPLRDCQYEAITSLETSLANNHPRALIHMATGAGKTFTAVTEIYRLLKFAKVRRILFLVDRNSLGTQAKSAFDNYTAPDTGRLFSDVYNVSHLGPSGFDNVNQVVISTIQRLFAQLKGDPVAIDEEDEEENPFEPEQANGEPVEVAYQPALPPETFDLIIIDECHRSIYGKWKQVLDYFDAFLVGLTATPSVDTLAFFNQNVVSRYPYEQSVLDGVNVDYIAYRVATRIGTEGASLPSGSNLELFDSYHNTSETHAIEDELDYSAKELGRSVIAKDQIRKVLEVYRDSLFTQFFPGRTGDWVPKTLIFAKTDTHADAIVRIAREVFGKGNNFCRKITHKATSSAVPSKQLIQNFRIQPEFRIAVTVDMVATGVDIKPLECLIFLRDVCSPLLYAQMKGRGCRTCPPDDLANVTPDAPANTKTHFVIIDAVGVEESEKLANSPADRRQTITLRELVEGIVSGERNEPDDYLSLGRRLTRLAGKARTRDLAALESELGQPLTQWAEQITALGQTEQENAPNPSEEILTPLASEKLRQLIFDLRGYSPVLIDILSQDEVLGQPEAITPRRTVENFTRFLEENRDRLLALQIIYNQRPGSGLTFNTIQELKDSLAQPPYHLAPESVWQAYEALEKTTPKSPPVKILTNLITLVRHTLDPAATPLSPFPELVETRFQDWLTQHDNHFTEPQRHWLNIIKTTIATNGAFPTDDQAAYLETWENVASTEQVPLAVARKAFGHDPKDLIIELNEALIA